jgi:hypothetical protein
MIDFAGIPRRVCSDSSLREEFLRDPVKVTARLLNESYASLTSGLLELSSEPQGGADGLVHHHSEEDLTVPVSR